MPSVLTRADYENFLVRAYFGSTENPLQACLHRAYLDFARTLHNIGAIQVKPYAKAESVLNRKFASIKDAETPTQEQFDKWHSSTCVELKNTYKECGYDLLFVGQAQKWINMTFKYIFTLGEAKFPGYSHLYHLCHIPFDNIVLKKLRSDGFPSLPCPWSRLNSYDTYLDRQNWVRKQFDLAPLDVEFRLWMDAPLMKND
jgi:hypothetical protein